MEVGPRLVQVEIQLRQNQGDNKVKVERIAPGLDFSLYMHTVNSV